MKIVKAKQSETWDIIAKRELGYEYYAKDIMLYNPELSDVVIFDGTETVYIPEFGLDESVNVMPEGYRNDSVFR